MLKTAKRYNIFKAMFYDFGRYSISPEISFL